MPRHKHHSPCIKHLLCGCVLFTSSNSIALYGHSWLQNLQPEHLSSIHFRVKCINLDLSLRYSCEDPGSSSSCLCNRIRNIFGSNTCSCNKNSVSCCSHRFKFWMAFYKPSVLYPGLYLQCVQFHANLRELPFQPSGLQGRPEFQ